MPFDEFVYPSYEEPLVDAYGGRFESVYVILHPFIRMPDAFSWRNNHHYPEDAEILAYGEKYAWAEVASQAGIGACARLNQALLTSIGSVPEHLSDCPGRDKLQGFLQSSPVWMPVEGRFEPLLQADILSVFETAGHRGMVYVPEFPENEPVRTLQADALKRRTVSFPACGSLLAPDESFLFTVDWDSFFTLFYGRRSFVETVVREREIEGFFAARTTEHAWFNYSFGCATVTLSPEHWPA